jgi:hypothetical protein
MKSRKKSTHIMKTSFVHSWLCPIQWWVVSPALATVLSLNVAAQTNILSSPGFETGNLSGWNTFGPNNSVLSTIGYAHGGSFFYKVYGQFNTTYNYAGIYQDNPAAPGNTYTADGWTFSRAGLDLDRSKLSGFLVQCAGALSLNGRE